MDALTEQPLRVDLVFNGEILDGFDAAAVKQALGERFKLDDARRQRMFSGVPFVIKRGVGPEDASRYIALFEKLGGRLHAQGGPAPAAAPVARAAPAASPPPAAAPVLALAPLAPLAPAPVDDARARRAEPAPRAESRARFRDSEPYVAPQVVQVHEPASVFGIGLEGRLARRPYGAAALFGWAAMRWALMAIAMHPTRGMVLLAGLGILVAALWTIRLTVLRLHDVGLSAWWVLVGFIPIVGTLAGIALSLVPGSTGENRFGAEPDQGNPILRLVVVVAVIAIGSGFRNGLLLSVRPPAATSAQAADSPAAADAHMAPTDDELAFFVKSAAARGEFRGGYWSARTHKAFAASDSGAWGWSADAGTAEAAKAQALEQCEKRRDAYSTECRALNVDGDWSD